jgi:hypothetical protein
MTASNISTVEELYVFVQRWVQSFGGGLTSFSLSSSSGSFDLFSLPIGSGELKKQLLAVKTWFVKPGNNDHGDNDNGSSIASDDEGVSHKDADDDDVEVGDEDGGGAILMKRNAPGPRGASFLQKQQQQPESDEGEVEGGLPGDGKDTDEEELSGPPTFKFEESLFLKEGENADTELEKEELRREEGKQGKEEREEGGETEVEKEAEEPDHPDEGGEEILTNSPNDDDAEVLSEEVSKQDTRRGSTTLLSDSDRHTKEVGNKEVDLDDLGVDLAHGDNNAGGDNASGDDNAGGLHEQTAESSAVAASREVDGDGAESNAEVIDAAKESAVGDDDVDSPPSAAVVEEEGQEEEDQDAQEEVKEANPASASSFSHDPEEVVVSVEADGSLTTKEEIPSDTPYSTAISSSSGVENIVDAEAPGLFNRLKAALSPSPPPLDSLTESTVASDDEDDGTTALHSENKAATTTAAAATSTNSTAATAPVAAAEKGVGEAEDSTSSEEAFVAGRVRLWSTSEVSLSNPSVAAALGVYEPDGNAHGHTLYKKVGPTAPPADTANDAEAKAAAAAAAAAAAIPAAAAAAPRPSYLYRNPKTDKWTVTSLLANVEKIKGTIVSVGAASTSDPSAENEGFKVFSNGKWTVDPAMTVSALTSDLKKADAASVAAD